MKLVVLTQAQEEIDDLVFWYEERDDSVADRLVDLYSEALQQVVLHPERYQLLECRRNPAKLRRIALMGYPIYVVYHRSEKVLTVVAVHHASRRFGAWHKR